MKIGAEHVSPQLQSIGAMKLQTTDSRFTVLRRTQWQRSIGSGSNERGRQQPLQQTIPGDEASDDDEMDRPTIKEKDIHNEDGDDG